MPAVATQERYTKADYESGVSVPASLEAFLRNEYIAEDGEMLLEYRSGKTIDEFAGEFLESRDWEGRA